MVAHISSTAGPPQVLRQAASVPAVIAGSYRRYAVVQAKLAQAAEQLGA